MRNIFFPVPTGMDFKTNSVLCLNHQSACLRQVYYLGMTFGNLDPVVPDLWGQIYHDVIGVRRQAFYYVYRPAFYYFFPVAVFIDVKAAAERLTCRIISPNLYTSMRACRAGGGRLFLDDLLLGHDLFCGNLLCFRSGQVNCRELSSGNLDSLIPCLRR